MTRLVLQKDYGSVVARDDGSFRVGNRDGLSALDKLDTLARNVKELQDQVAGLLRDKETATTDMTTVKGRLAKVESLSKETMKARNRFFSTYIRDKRPELFKENEEKEQAIIDEGNEAVHFGSPMNDAYIFEEVIS